MNKNLKKGKRKRKEPKGHEAPGTSTKSFRNSHSQDLVEKERKWGGENGSEDPDLSSLSF